MKKSLGCLLICGIVGLLEAGNLSAAPKDDGFFPKDYVNGPLDKGHVVGTPVPHPSPKAMSEETPDAIVGTPKDDWLKGFEVEPTLAPMLDGSPASIMQEEISLQDGDGGQDASCLGAVLFAKDKEGFLKDLVTLFGAIKRTGIAPGEISVVRTNFNPRSVVSATLRGLFPEAFRGKIVPGSISMEQLKKINEEMKEKALPYANFMKAVLPRIKYSYTVPKKYPVASSPTWLLCTKEGEVLAEGIPLQRILTKKGKFLKPT